MTEQNNKPQEVRDTRTASQRIEDLEKAVMSVFQVVNQLGGDVNTIKEAIKLLGNKVDAIVKATQRGLGLNDDIIGQIMIENNIEELKQRVTNYKTQGYFVDQAQIDDNSFIVGSELDTNGTTVQPRLQFGFSALAAEVKEKLRGAKAGDLIDFGENKYKFLVQEVYEVVDPNAQKAEDPTAEAPVAAVATEAAPAAEAAAPTQDSTQPTASS